MIFWVLFAVLCCAGVAVVVWPLLGRANIAGAAPPVNGLQIYQDQLAEVDRDLQNGAILAVEASAVRAEIERRLNQAARSQVNSQDLPRRWLGAALAATAGVVLLGSISLYAVLGRPDLTVAQPELPQTAQLDAMMAQLSERVLQKPGDAEAWRMLGLSQFMLQHYAEAASAYAKAIALEPDDVALKSAYAEALVQAAQGVVTLQAKTVITEVLAKNPKDVRGRFYEAMGIEQAGDLNAALDRWLTLLADAAGDAPWRQEVLKHVSALGTSTGRDVSVALLPPATGAMIDGMIAQLAGKLAENPNNPEGWVMMIRSLAVKGDRKNATEALVKAQDIFKDDKAVLEQLSGLALALGLPAEK
jgi:cytochrome c-type biogenesis protein CcmH